jgi:hypothetical protein
VPDRIAASCTDSPASSRNLSISRTRRMAMLSVGIGSSEKKEKP